MKYWMIVLAACLAGAALSGCERKGSTEDPKRFDSKIDAPTSPYDVRTDPLLLEDQSKIARQSGKKRPAVIPATGDAVEAVKQTLANLLQAASTGKVESIAPFLADEEDAKVFVHISKVAAETEEKQKAFADLLKERLGMDVPQELGAFSSQNQNLTASILSEAKDSLEKTQFEQTKDGSIVATDPGGRKTTFVQVEGAWKIKLQPNKKEALMILPEVIGGLAKTLDTLSTGVLDGSITQETLKAKTEEIIATNLQKSLEKLVKVIAASEAAKSGTSEAANPAGEGAAVAATSAPAEGEKDPGQLEAIATLWKDRKTREQATAEFLAINWQAKPNFPPNSFLAMSEEQLIALPTEELEQKKGEWFIGSNSPLNQLRSLAKNVISQGKKATDAGDAAKGKQYFDAVTAFGKFLDDPSRMKGVQLVGQAIIKSANKAAGAAEEAAAGEAKEEGEPNALAPSAEPNASAAEPNAAATAPEDDVNKDR
jgi:hypothetical protein